MAPSIINFFSIFSGICSITAFFLYFITINKTQKTISFLVSSVFIGLPLILLLIKENIWVFSAIIIIYSISIIIFSFFYGKTKAEQKNELMDLLLVSHNRMSGREWLIEKISAIKTGDINIDVYGVKLDALYQVIKGSTYKSKLPNELNVNMRVLFLEPNSFGVHSRSIIEQNDKVEKDVELMKDVWIKLVKEYKKHKIHSLKVKTFDFTPSFYILRVNEKMLIGMYLAESGFENISFHLQRKDGKVFNQFERYFERIWTNYSKNIIGTKT